MSVLETKSWTVCDYGEFFLLDNGCKLLTNDYLEYFANAFKHYPRLAIVGAKRLSADGNIFSMGERLIHAKGYHQIGQGLPKNYYVFPEEVDVISGGMLAISKAYCDEINTDCFSSLSSIDLCLGLRKKGGRIMSLPHVMVEDEYLPRPDALEAEAFKRKWKFDWSNADLRGVWRRYKGTEILWDLSIHPEVTEFEKYSKRGAYHWQSYRDIKHYRERVNLLIQEISKLTNNSTVLDFGCGDGLYSHLIAKESNCEITGIDIEEDAIKQARAMTAQQDYTHKHPTFKVRNKGPLDFPDGHFDTIIMLDVIEHLSNPVAILRDLKRCLKKDGVLFLSTPEWHFHRIADPYHVNEYTIDELGNQLTRTGFQVLANCKMPSPHNDIIALAQNPT